MKISEHFKPPPKITLPQSVLNRLAQVDSGRRLQSTTANYDFELESTVLKRLSEWRVAKEKERYERDERVRVKELERTRLAEEEQKRKLNQISYPNTDDLSSASEGEVSDEENDESSPSGSSEERLRENNTTSVVSSMAGHLNKFDTILMPTVLPDVATSAIVSTEKMIDSNTPLNFSIPKNTNLLNNNNSIYSKINYSDFENDTSSPFDNMELKTINDLDILAQVYNLDICNSGSERSPGESNESDTKMKENHEETMFKNQTTESSVGQKESVTPQQPYQVQSQYPSAAYSQNSGQVNQTSDYYKSFSSYHYNYGQFVPSSAASDASFMPVDSRFFGQYTSPAGTSYQQPVQSQYHQPYSQGPVGSYNYYPYTSSSNASATQSTYANAYFYNSAYGHQSPSTHNYNYSGHTNTATAAEVPSAGYIQGASGSEPFNPEAAEEPSSMKSKSKSVPDIVRQLDEEVKDSALRRTRNNSQSVVDDKQQDKDKSVEKSESAQNFTLYNQLSPTDQILVKSIGSMGFPLERVAAVLLRIGSDDKKIVEHLIPLSELLDLGFEEQKISEALVKYDNNKHKALDYLIS